MNQLEQMSLEEQIARINSLISNEDYAVILRGRFITVTIDPHQSRGGIPFYRLDGYGEEYNAHQMRHILSKALVFAMAEAIAWWVMEDGDEHEHLHWS